jgi:tetraacyldisaccharide 4'-kinase
MRSAASPLKSKTRARATWPRWIAAAPLSLVYGGILVARSVWWARYGQTSPLPTISVGNLTVGGNGKTPFTLFLASRLCQSGLRVAIVSRGYGGMRVRGARLVSDGRHIALSPLEAGDEPVMMAKCFEGPLAVARRRIEAIRLLDAKALADVVVLDDGFQHVRLRRDVDLLLINRTVGLGNGWLLPAGPLREPKSAIQRADALILVESFGFRGASLGCGAFEATGGTVLRARLLPSELTYSRDGIWRQLPLQLDQRRVVAVSGVANPAGFHAMLGALGAKLLHTIDYPDHYDYGPRDWQHILAVAKQAEMLITTEKDLVKLERFGTVQIPLYALRLTVTMNEEDERRLLDLIMQRIGKSIAADEALSSSAIWSKA